MAIARSGARKSPLWVIRDRDEPAAGRAPFRYAPKATENRLRPVCRDGPEAAVVQSEIEKTNCR
jgi:hypothetical protein